MKLTANTINITNTFSTARMTLANTNIVESISLGNVYVSPSQITVGNVLITPTAVSVPTLILGGFAFDGPGAQGGIINYQAFTANGTWYNPYANASANASLTGYEQVLVMAWGAGGGGSSNNSNARSGGGGSCIIGYNTLSNFPNTVSVIVGLGGANARTTTTAQLAAGNGGNSSFGSLTAYGGGGGSSVGGGGGGGAFSNGSPGAAGGPIESTFNVNTSFGGANVNSSSIFGGGGGSTGAGNGGMSIFGGGGGGAGTSGNYGNSIFGGNGGNATSYPAVPGGGGYANSTSAPQNGANGEVRVWVFGPAATTLGIPTYALSPNVSTVNVGGSVLYTVSTTNLANNTTLYYTLNNSSTATSADFTTAVNGFVVVSNQSAQYTITTNSSSVANKNFYFDLRTGSTTGTIVGNSSITTTNPTYALSPNTASFFESGSVLYTITTQGVSNGTTLYYSLNNSSTATSADFSTAVNGSVIINGNANTFTLTAADDADGAETFYVDLRTGSTSGTLVANSSTVTINPKTYALTANVTSFYEGTSVRYTITTTGVTNGTTLYYTLNNSSTATSADFSTAVNGSVVINGGSNSFVLTSVIDGDSTNEAFRMDMRTGSTTGTIVATNNSVSITALPNSSWIASYNSIANTTSYTFNSVSWGSIPSSDRYIVVAVGARSGNTQAAITSMTIGGTAAALTATAAANQPRAVGIASVPTGTSGTVVVNSDQNLDVAVIGVWAVYGVTSTTAVDSAANTNLGSPTSTTISTGLSAGDFVASVGIGAQDTEHVWTGGSPAITEDFQETFLDSQIKVSFASAILTGSASQTHTVNTNVSVANRSSIATVVYSR